jgi:membrane protease YdiL (CAAX protease family)
VAHSATIILSRVFGVPVMWQLGVAAALALLPLLIAGFAQRSLIAFVDKLPVAARIAAPALLCVPYVLVAEPLGYLRFEWLILYATMPMFIVWLMLRARKADHLDRGNWRDFLVLAVLGLAVDLRWFEPAWPPHFAVFNKMLLLDAVGFSFIFHGRDFKIGLREFVWYTPIALALGLVLGFLHVHAVLPRVSTLAVAYVFTFVFIAIPEELFFRGWLQNLLERRIGRKSALLLTSLVFGISHFNKRAVYFNWRYVLLASIAGIFYGRAWRRDRRVTASAITHACVDTVWSQWLR